MITFEELQSFHTYELPHRVTTCEVDPQNKLRPSHFLRLMQNAADLHSAELGVSQKELDEIGQIVVITRTSVLVHRYPVALEDLRIVTLHRCAKGVRLYRDFLFFSGDHVLAEATNEYCVLDRKTRRIQKPTVYSENPAFAPQNYVPGTRSPEKLPRPRKESTAGFEK